MSDTNQAETFTEAVDVTTQPEGAFIGTLEIEVGPEGIRNAEHLDELNALRDRIAELERENSELRSRT